MKDKIGIWTSIICLIHCLIFPVLATIFPVFLEIDVKVEISLITLAVIVGTLSFLDNVIKHKYYLSIFIFLLGFLSIFASVLKDNELLHILGISLLILAHYLNYKKIKKIDGCHPHGCKH